MIPLLIFAAGLTIFILTVTRKTAVKPVCKEITLCYTARFDDEHGEFLPFFEEADTSTFVTGRNEKPLGFEKKIMGYKKGQKFAFSVEDVFGEYEDKLANQMASIEALKEATGKEKIEIGMMFRLNTGQLAKVTDINGSIASLDFNHPLAGKTIFYKGEIIDIKNVN